jgi:hypothetical protein
MGRRSRRRGQPERRGHHNTKGTEAVTLIGAARYGLQQALGHDVEGEVVATAAHALRLLTEMPPAGNEIDQGVMIAEATKQAAADAARDAVRLLDQAAPLPGWLRADMRGAAMPAQIVLQTLIAQAAIAATGGSREPLHGAFATGPVRDFNKTLRDLAATADESTDELEPNSPVIEEGIEQPLFPSEAADLPGQVRAARLKLAREQGVPWDVVRVDGGIGMRDAVNTIIEDQNRKVQVIEALPNRAMVEITATGEHGTVRCRIVEHDYGHHVVLGSIRRDREDAIALMPGLAEQLADSFAGQALDHAHSNPSGTPAPENETTDGDLKVRTSTLQFGDGPMYFACVAAHDEADGWQIALAMLEPDDMRIARISYDAQYRHQTHRVIALVGEPWHEIEKDPAKVKNDQEDAIEALGQDAEGNQAIDALEIFHWLTTQPVEKVREMRQMTERQAREMLAQYLSNN